MIAIGTIARISTRKSVVRVRSRGGGASKSQPLPIPGQPFYLGERKLAAPTCRDEVAEVVEALAVGGGDRVLTVERYMPRWPLAGPLGHGRRLRRPCYG